MIHAPVLGQSDVTLLACLAGPLGWLSLHFTNRIRLQVGRFQHGCMFGGTVCHTGHTLCIQAWVVTSPLPERQQVWLNAVAEVTDHSLRVVRELAHAAFDVCPCDCHAVHQHLRIDPAIELAELGAHASASCFNLVRREYLVTGKLFIAGLGLHRCRNCFSAYAILGWKIS